MARVFDVAAFIVQELETLRTMKLEKLAYYTQVWSLVRDKVPMFPERFEAWRYGPVCPPLYSKHQGQDAVCAPWPYGDASRLTETEKTTTSAVLFAYGKKSSHWLSDLTHREDPWMNARKGLAPEERGNTIITHEAMVEYYALAESTEKRQVLSYGQPQNQLIDYMMNMDDEDAAVLDELALLDADPEVAKLTR